MQGFLEKLASAFVTAEGGFTGEFQKRLNNPFNLRNAPWLSVIVKENGFVKFNSWQEGIAGGYHQLALDIARGLTLEQLVHKYAPGSDGNDENNYVKETARRVGIDPKQKLWEYLEIEKIP